MSGLSECLLLFFPTHYLYDITTVTGYSVSSPPRMFLVVLVKTAVTADPHKTDGSRVADVCLRAMEGVGALWAAHLMPAHLTLVLTLNNKAET